MEENDDRAHELRKKQLAEMQKEAQLREMLRKLLDQTAFERLMNIRISSRDMYLQIAQLLIYASQQGQLRGQLTERDLISIINKIKSEEREGSITFKRK